VILYQGTEIEGNYVFMLFKLVKEKSSSLVMDVYCVMGWLFPCFQFLCLLLDDVFIFFIFFVEK